MNDKDVKERTIAIIPARGGSKRIPKKNIQNFCGIPILSYSIKAALSSDIFDEVMVSTDSEEIAEIAQKYGAVVPFMRSYENSGDYATTEDVIIEVINQYSEIGKKYDYACCIYPTAPFVDKDILIKSIKKMEKYKPSVIIPVVEFSYPPQRSLVIDDTGYAKFKYPQYCKSRSQDLEKYYHDAGQFYIYNVRKLIETGGNIVDGFMPIILPDIMVQDIDNKADWEIAEMKYKYINNI